MKRQLRIFSVAIAVGLIGATYYFVGHHNHIGSRSFTLEKDIRSLRYVETHEPIDYRVAVERYRYLLERIRFDERQSNYTERYEKALSRSEMKAAALVHFDLYSRTLDESHIRKGWEIITSPEFKALDESFGSTFYWNDTLIDDAWIRNKRKK